MLLETIKFELLFRARRKESYLYFFIILLYAALSVDFIYEGSLGPIKLNAPYVVAECMTISSAFMMVIVSMIMGTGVLKDFQYNFNAILFSKPISKLTYISGRFIGSFIVLLIISSALIWGMSLGLALPWRNKEDMLPFNLWTYIQPFVLFVLPTLFYSAAIFFITGALSKKLIVVYTQGIVFFMLYVISIVLLREDESGIAQLIDPFAFQTIKSTIQFWTPLERNITLVPFSDYLLYNRLLWIIVGGLVLIWGSIQFSFNELNKHKSHKKRIKTDLQNFAASLSNQKPLLNVMSNHNLFSKIQQLLSIAQFHFTAMMQEAAFWVVIISAIVSVIINSISLGTTYGVDSYPMTYLVIEELQESSILFFLIVLVFYSAELIWKERDIRIACITDATPVASLVTLSGKLVSLALMYILLIVAIVVTGVSFQTVTDFYDYRFDIYFIEFFIGLLPFLLLYSIASFFIHALSNHKYIGHVLMILFFVTVNAMEPFGISHPLYTYAHADLGTYSDMNGYGHFDVPYFWSMIYWFAFAIILIVIGAMIKVRGAEAGLPSRSTNAIVGFSTQKRNLIMAALSIFLFSGCYIYYNVNSLNDFTYPSTERTYRADYEKALKEHEYLPQPKIVDVHIDIDLYPEARDYTAIGRFTLVNQESEPINQVHIQKNPGSHIHLSNIEFGAAAHYNDEFKNFGYHIYTLKKPLQPQDSITMEFCQEYITNGFSTNPKTEVVQNGTFITNDHFPTIGYHRKIELRDKQDRQTNGLPERIDFAGRKDIHEIKNGRTGGDGYEINLDIKISTNYEQTAIAPGKLVNKWQENGRSFFHYKTATPIINFYSIVSAEFEHITDKWTPAEGQGQSVDLQISFHKGHSYNVQRMIHSMHASLDYYTDHFGPYPYSDLRIMEFPRYQEYAQSFPGNIPFSEGLGFILDIDDKVDIDMVHFITAHEIAHQWWGLQLVAANVKGRHMILESLAQYSALMVMKSQFPLEKINQILLNERERYLHGRAVENYETPLALTENRKYLHYGKGAYNLFALQQYIGEDNMNLALRNFISDWNAFGGEKQVHRYATTVDLLTHFRARTPDSLQYLISDLFETITIHEIKVNEVINSAVDNQFQIAIEIDARKVRFDSVGIKSFDRIHDFVDVGLYMSDNNGVDTLYHVEQILVQDTISNVTLYTDHLISKVKVDPLLKLMEIDIKDNEVKINRDE